jgi:hypothetical protein
MPDKQRFSFLLRPDERATLRMLAELADRSEGATLRQLIRQAARELTTQSIETIQQSVQYDEGR